MIFKDKNGMKGIMPVFMDGRTLRFVSDKRVTDMADLLYEEGFERAVVNSLMEFIKKEKMKIDLFPVPENSILVDILVPKSDSISAGKHHPNPVIELPSDIDTYLRNLEGKKRRDLRRKMKNCRGAELVDLDASSIDILFEQMEESSAEKKKFLTGEIRSFFRRLSDEFQKCNTLHFKALKRGEENLAVIFGFKNDERIFAYNTGFRIIYSSISPGIVAFIMDIFNSIENGYRVYDFLRGDENFKYNLGASRQHYLRLNG